ncbi:MAG: protein translocase subunit SecD [Vicinamibacterales bacterium]|jgi:preprotein translocase subunit SecD|nr:protein translocase subunit SecD [Acidobacteriota bacterium]MDP7211148.1 protein translocase subunit SecD [Vicinamibacterales bacterium]HJO16712.1 protein translocase subunit SecD [Vicinamibacterales bacterium]|tara:strand:- start:717 stop:2285 length:1569 start_codon:yes stop_codon:yes gene_type:complete
MNKNLRWKLLLIVGIVALAGWSVYPPEEKVRLGLDLKGGVHMVLRVQTDDALRIETETSLERVREILEVRSIGVGAMTMESPTRFRIEGVSPAQDAEFRAITDEQLLVVYRRESSAGGRYAFEMRPNMAVSLREESVRQALQTIERRVNELGVNEPIVAPHGVGGDQILVQLPGVSDVARAKEIIRSTALLELKLVEQGPAISRETLLQANGGRLPDGMEVVPGTDDTLTPGAAPQSVFYLVRRVAAITGRDLRTARSTLDEYNQPAVSFLLNGDGARKFGNITSQNIGRQLAIILDGRVYSAPVIESRITDEGRITGYFSQEEAADLGLVLRSGALPASLTYLEERRVGPTLGADSVRAGILASVTGLLLVAFFMLVYYKLAGINAILSVALNLLILLGVMAYLNATMTLPGIAGFILTIGMGIDSNVLIFERIKEELASAKNVRLAVAAGFDRVFLTILDTHVASLIAAAFLFQFGTGPIRGFATTLFFGLLSNVFTAVFVSRTLFETILTRRRVAKLSI